MLVMNRNSGVCEVRKFSDLTDYLDVGDCLVVNNTRVMSARLFGRKEDTGAEIEILLINSADSCYAEPSETSRSAFGEPLPENKRRWNCLLCPAKRVRPGTRIRLLRRRDCRNGTDTWITVVGRNGNAFHIIEFDTESMEDIQKNFGHIPLPPYIRRPDEKVDRERYQTVFAGKPGAVAAPTAGLHFTPEIFAELKNKGVNKAEITLHVGPGTFQPVRVKNIRDHKMHSEYFILSENAAETINKTRKMRGRVLAVGTTTLRALESCAENGGRVVPREGTTDIFLYPPYKPKIADMLLTNFHLPQSTLLMLVCTFAKREYILHAYEVAKREKMRFYSYGDCMLLY